MKIDEACINHNVALLTEELTACIYECDKDEQVYNLLTLAEIKGVIDLADRLKEVLKA